MDVSNTKMAETGVLNTDKYRCDVPYSKTGILKKFQRADDIMLRSKINEDTFSIKSETKRDLLLGAQKLNLKELQMDGLTPHAICNDKSKRNSLSMDHHNDNIKSNIPRTFNSQRKRLRLSIYDMGAALLAGNGLFHSWMLCLPMLIIVQSSYYNFIRLLLSTMFILYFTKWSPYYKIYKLINWMVCLLRYRRVERYCDKCERQLLQQLNNENVKVKPTEASSGDNKCIPSQNNTHQKEMERSDQLQIESNHNSCEEIPNTTIENTDQTRPPKSPQRIGWRLRSWRRFPWRVFSRNWGRIANTQFYPQFINTFLIWLYANGFGCNLDESEEVWTNYKTLGHFFTRKLKPGIRPVSNIATLVSPADGTLTHFGQFKGGFLEQIKGAHYSISYFLGLHTSVKSNINATDSIETSHASISEKAITSSLLHQKDGSTVLMQMIIYLSPGDYHRFHSPADWSVNYRRHFPGELLSVKPSVAGNFPGLFHLNERVCWFGEWKHGFFSMTAVAATNVGDIVEDGPKWENECDDQEDQLLDSLKTNRAYGLKRDCTFMGTCAQVGKKFLYYSERKFENPRIYKKGDAFGHFNFGSTIVLLFEAPRHECNSFPIDVNDKLKVGEAIYK